LEHVDQRAQRLDGIIRRVVNRPRRETPTGAVDNVRSGREDLGDEGAIRRVTGHDADTSGCEPGLERDAPAQDEKR
jgi:hypothetical protein